MSNISACVITPTVGRLTLHHALTSAWLESQDQWLVVGDGAQPGASAVVNKLRADGRTYLHYLELNPAGGRFGHPARDLAMSFEPLRIHRAKADYLLFLDDDDIFAPGVWPEIKYELSLYAPRPIIFRMINHTGEILWKEPVLTPGNVGGSMLAVPNNKDKLARWSDTSDRYGCDFDFIKSILAHYRPDEICWSGNVIVICRPPLLD